MTDVLGWRRAFDSVERNVSPRVETLVHSDHIRNRNGKLHDLVMLAHFVDGMWAGMDAIGLSDELASPRP